MNANASDRRPVGSYESYAEAQRAVDHLSDSKFPVERVTIVGHGLRYVEQVAGRLTTGRAALVGAAQGSMLGALFGLFFGLVFDPEPETAIVLLVLYGLVAGAILGALLGAVSHAATGGRRDFASVGGMEAERYDIVVDAEVADQAQELLRNLGPVSGGAPTA
jgi:hypothetical protein